MVFAFRNVSCAAVRGVRQDAGNRTALLEGRAFSPLRRLEAVVWDVAAVRNIFRREIAGDTCGPFARTSSGRKGGVCAGGNRLPDEGAVYERYYAGVPASGSRFPDRRICCPNARTLVFLSGAEEGGGNMEV